MAESNKNIWKWIGIGGLLYFIWGATVRTVLYLQFKLSGLQPVRADERSTTFNLFLSVKNPTYHTMILREIRFDLYFNNTLVANIDQIVNRYIKSKAVSVLTIQVTTNNNDIMSKIFEQLSSGIIDNWTISMRGMVRADNSYYPYNLTFLAEDIFPQLVVNGK